MKKILFLCLALLLTGCAAAPASPAESSDPKEETLLILPTETVPAPTLSPEQTILDGMSLRQKVGQLFVVQPEALNVTIPTGNAEHTGPAGLTRVTQELRQALEQYPVGGFVLFSRNILNPDQLLTFNLELRHAVPIAPFQSVDEEGGIVARLARHPAFDLPTYKSAGAVGALGDPNAALDMGRTIGNYLKLSGFNMDFAPVADVNTNPSNPIIGTRAFSPDPEHAAACARAMADGLTENGIVPVFKHFPGHGDTAEDSHVGLAVSRRTAEQMEACEWLPFREAGSRDCIMVGHIALPEVTGDMTPATLSPAIVDGLLRQELGFRGLVITDAMNMGAITQTCSSGQAALAALEAGCDLILMPQSLPEAFDAVLAAAEDGSFPQDQLDRIVLRILRFKLDQGIITH